jgi:cell division protease FtsH
LRQSHKTILLWIILIVMFVSVYQLFTDSGKKEEPKDFSELKAEILDEKAAGAIEKIEIQPKGDNAATYIVTYKDRPNVKVIAKGEYFAETLHKFEQAGITTNVVRKEQSSFWQNLIISWLPMLFLFVIFFFFMRQLQAGGGKAMSFG